MAQLVVMYPKPNDPAQFQRFYSEVHLPLVEKMPGIRSYRYGYPEQQDEKEPAYFCFFIASFDSVAAIHEAFNSPAGKDVIADIPNYSPDHQPTMLFLDDAGKSVEPGTRQTRSLGA